MEIGREPPRFPVGEFDQRSDYDEATKARYVDEIREAPSHLRNAVDGLQPTQLDTLYKNWTIRQIVHHLTDSHVHSYIRFKWALTEDNPVIKAYDENDWSALHESRTGAIGPSLNLLSGLHQRWVQLIQMMPPDAFARTFVHPELQETVSLALALGYYAWHGRHHTGQILWLREHHQW